MEKIFYNAGLTEIEYLIIENIKALRKERNMSKQELSKKMGVAISFIGKAENYAFREKYSVRHLALAAKALGLQSVKDIMPNVLPKNDRIKITFKKVFKTNKDGTSSKHVTEEIVSIEPL